jgi:hypothetical protein
VSFSKQTSPRSPCSAPLTHDPKSNREPPSSRLGCQVIAAKELDGLRVKLPSATRNFYVSQKGAAAQQADKARLAAASASAAGLWGGGGGEKD